MALKQIHSLSKRHELKYERFIICEFRGESIELIEKASLIKLEKLNII